jgi:dienelactone hydrolase
MYDATFDDSMSEIDRAVEALRQRGAKKVVVAGQSMGANAALGYAATRQGADAVIALAPGHTPDLISATFAGDVQRARDLIAAGNGKEKQQFGDSNRGTHFTVTATPEVYLSWFDPDGSAVVPKSAAAIKKPLPILTIIASRGKTISSPRRRPILKATS